MPRPKKNHTLHGAWVYLGCDIEKTLKSDPSDALIPSSQIVAVMVAAICPKGFAEAATFDSGLVLVRLFAEFYSSHPNLVIRLMRVIRDKWESKVHGHIAQRFISTQAWLRRPHYEIVGIHMSTSTDDEISIAIKKSGLPSITTATIRKARQRLTIPKVITIREDLYAALKELRSRGHEVGLGV